MPIRLVLPLAFLAGAAAVCAHAQDATTGIDENAPSPVEIKADTVKVVHLGKTKDDARGVFGIVNAGTADCYAIAPPSGEIVTKDAHYAVVPTKDVDEAARKKLEAAYPKCKIVEMVARVMR